MTPVLKRLPLLLVLLLPVHAQRTATPDLSTNTQSSAFTTPEERLAFLERYLNFQSEPRNAQYHLVYKDNSQGSPPGPSDWDFRIVLWLEPADVSLWLQDVREVDVINGFGWVSELSPDLGASVLEEARYFEGAGKRAALLEEGVLALWYSTLH